jgi:hypothetical protein
MGNTTTAIRAVSVSCPKINHNHLVPAHGYKETVRDLRFSQRCRWRFKTQGVLPDPKDKGTIILRKVRNYLPIDTALTSNKTSQFQKKSFIFQNGQYFWQPIKFTDTLVCSTSLWRGCTSSTVNFAGQPLFLVFVFWSKWYTVSQNSNQLIFVGTCVGTWAICLLPGVQDSNHIPIQME